MKICPQLCLAVALVLAAGSPSRAADVYDLDPTHFSIVFSVGHMNLSYTYGMFRRAQAQVVLDRENPAATQFQLTIDADSIDTNNAQRDTHLKGPDFFDTASFPTITFQSTSVVLDPRTDQPGINYQVTGNLTMHGVTRQVTLPVRLLGEAPGPDGKQHAGFLTQTELKRNDFQIGTARFPDSNMVGDAVGITISFEGVKRDGAVAPPPR